MSFEIYPISDIPLSDVKLLGHDKIVGNLKKFLMSNRIITPLSIAINGDWGSGKTSIVQSLKGKLDESKFDVIFFEAWKYEYSNPSIALINEIVQKYKDSSNADQIKKILELAVYVLAQKFLNFDPSQIVKLFDSKANDSKMFTHSIRDFIRKYLRDKKALVIIIDDLDRCDVENTLQVLSLMKLFLDVEKCICIAAVDLNRLEQAWKKQYGIDKNDKNGMEYLDKIFQIKINLHAPTMEHIRGYLQELIPDIKDDYLNLFSNLLSRNPRTIKRTLNLMSYRQITLSSESRQISACLWTILEEILTSDTLIRLFEGIKKDGNTIPNLIITNGDKWDVIKSATIDKHYLGNTIVDFSKLKYYFDTVKRILDATPILQKLLESDFEELYVTTKQH